MPTLGGEKLSFTKNDDGLIAVSAPDSAQTTLGGETIASGAGLAIPISGILKTL